MYKNSHINRFCSSRSLQERYFPDTIPAPEPPQPRKHFLEHSLSGTGSLEPSSEKKSGLSVQNRLREGFSLHE